VNHIISAESVSNRDALLLEALDNQVENSFSDIEHLFLSYLLFWLLLLVIFVFIFIVLSLFLRRSLSRFFIIVVFFLSFIRVAFAQTFDVLK
jgi:hypothetical protein